MTTPTTLSGIDLNLLTAFRAVEETRHVTRAAQRLGMSQPALSQALGRLRQQFGDPLFLRTPRGMVLTPLAESIAPPIRHALAQIETEVIERGPFRPAELHRTFRIRSTDFMDALFAGPLLGRLRTDAPSVRLALLPVGLELPKEELEAGTCDLGIAGFFGQLPDGFYQRLLLTDRFACALSRRHPRIKAMSSLDLDTFCAETHILVAPGGELTGAVDQALARKRKSREVVLGASGFISAAWQTSQSESILTAPGRLLQMLAAPLELALFAPPIELPEIRVVQVWHGRTHADPAHVWFRDLVAQSVAVRDPANTHPVHSQPARNRRAKSR